MRFVILPDHPAGARTAAQLEADGARLLRHASGRPWIVGWWTDEDLMTASVEDSRVAVLGRTTADSRVLERYLRGIRTGAGLTRLAGELSGCFHLVSSLAGRVRAQGSLAGVYRIYFGHVNGVTMAADRPDWLVRWTGASLDEDLLPLWQLQPYGPPWPLCFRSLWRGLHSVLPGYYLELDHHGGGRTGRWWSPPEPEVSRDEGAERVRAALEESLRARAGRAGSVRLSLDLSGGMDSTSLCYLAARVGVPFTTLHFEASDPSNPDSSWAERARRDLPGTRHVVDALTSTPGSFVEDTPPPSEVGLEGPATMVYRSLVEYLARLSAATGASRHVQGHGSDELFTPGVTMASALLRGHPWRRLRRIQAMRARQRVAFDVARRRLRYPESYRRWLIEAADGLTDDYRTRSGAGWEPAPRSPEWATPEAVAQAGALIRAAAEDGPEPLVGDPAGNAVLRGLQFGGQLVRQSSVIGEQTGVSFEGPYLDDRVLAAVMSIRLEDRFLAGVNKPVLAAAMRGVVPPNLLDRKDKSNGNQAGFDGVRRSRHRLEEALAEPLLARIGLVHADLLRSMVLGLQTDVERLMQLNATWASEMWLRALAQPGASTVAPPPVASGA